MKPPVVVHKRDRRPGDVYIGRGSKWGNPFRIGPEGSRSEVIDAYRQMISIRPDLLAALPELEGKRLVCYCAPLPCHGDVLVELVNATQGT